MKRLTIGALAALCAMLALPALVSATPVHLNPAPEVTSTIFGGASELTRVGGGYTTADGTTGTAVFENTTTGRLKLTFHAVRSGIGTFCKSAGQPAATVTTTELTFHLVMLAANTPGILITGNKTVGTAGTEGEGPWGHHFFDYGCGIFIPTIQVRGNGLLGTITSPECGKKSITVTVSFKRAAVGVQQHTSYTGTTYGLESSIGGGAYSASAMEAEATIGVSGTPELVCT